MQSSKGGPNRAYELGSKKILERLKTALSSKDEWATSLFLERASSEASLNAMREALKKVLVEPEKWFEEQLGAYLVPTKNANTQVRLFLREGETPGNTLPESLLYCIDEPKTAYRELLLAMSSRTQEEWKEEGLNELAKWINKRVKAPLSTTNRFLSIKSTSKTPRGVKAFGFALQAMTIASGIRKAGQPQRPEEEE